MDLTLRRLYTCWVTPDQLPSHLRDFVRASATKSAMKFPSFGIIDDGAPQAFTYGHHPGNARIVISRGIMELLEPDEVEAVVAHEIGHVHNWDMALMTVANLVPLDPLLHLPRGIRFGEGRGEKRPSCPPGWSRSAPSSSTSSANTSCCGSAGPANTSPTASPAR